MNSYPAQQPQQPQPQGYAVVHPQHVAPSHGGGYQTSAQNEYYYYYGGDEGKLTDITPTQDMVNTNQVYLQQQEEQMDPNHNNYSQSIEPQLIQQALLSQSPTAPALLYNTRDQQTYSMPIQKIDISTELHVATAFVSMSITFQNTSNSKVNTLFILPCNGTVTSTNIDINHGSRYLDTTFIDNDSAQQFQPKKQPKNQEQQPLNAYIPNLFRLPIANIAPNEIVTVNVDYMENLKFVESRYHLYVPLHFGHGILSNPNNISIKCSINCLTPGIQYGSLTHNLILTKQENLRCKLLAKPKQLDAMKNDFHLHYSVQTNAISAALLCDAGSPYEYDPLKSFTCFINPPAQMNGTFARDIVFMLDRSGSMTGKPFQDAVKGLKFALNTLTQHDRFSIIAFDHEQIHFDPTNEMLQPQQGQQQIKLFQAYPQTIQQANYFLDRLTPRGLTDIKTPLLSSINYLNNNYNTSLPFVVLLTDGAVENEKQIVQEIVNINNQRTRVLTFGIGRYCNEYFLKMLSLTTRGWNDGCIYPKDLFPKIRLMMDKAKTPILTDVELSLPGNLNAEIYPKTIPDLFVNGPIIISGKYSGNMPAEVILRGRLQNGQILEIPIRSDISEIVPVSKIFLKQRMDQLNAEYWLNGDEKIKKQIVDISINEKFPSPHTSMVAYELTPKEKKKQDKDKKKSRKKGGGLSGGQIAALAGGAVVIGAGVFLLGNVAATMGNINIIDGIGSGLADIGNLFGGIDCPCDGCMDAISCGNCDCGMLAKIGSCGVCANCDNCLDFIPCGQCDGGCVELPGADCIGGVCNSVGDAVGGLCNSCGDLASGVCGGCGGCDSIGDIAGNVCNSCGNLCGSVGDIAGTLCNSCGNLCGSVGDIAGNVCNSCGDIAGNIGECVPNCIGSFGDICGDLCGVFSELGGCLGDCGGGICDAIGGIVGMLDRL